jgi:hypothetical protein
MLTMLAVAVVIIIAGYVINTMMQRAQERARLSERLTKLTTAPMTAVVPVEPAPADTTKVIIEQAVVPELAEPAVATVGQTESAVTDAPVEVAATKTAANATATRKHTARKSSTRKPAAKK